MATDKTKPASFSAKRPSAAAGASNGVDKSLQEIQEPTKRLNILVPKSLHKDFSMFAVETDTDMSLWVRRWITEGMERERNKS